jgi:hypothetical protein
MCKKFEKLLIIYLVIGLDIIIILYIYMTENSKTFSRPLRIEDFLEPDTNKKNNNSRQNESIAKNQQEFGHKKRIKP